MILRLKTKQAAGKKLQVKLMHSSYVLGQIVQTLRSYILTPVSWWYMIIILNISIMSTYSLRNFNSLLNILISRQLIFQQKVAGPQNDFTKMMMIEALDFVPRPEVDRMFRTKSEGTQTFRLFNENSTGTVIYNLFSYVWIRCTVVEIMNRHV